MSEEILRRVPLCPHGEEHWYCDTCKLEFEKAGISPSLVELIGGLRNANLWLQSFLDAHHKALPAGGECADCGYRKPVRAER